MKLFSRFTHNRLITDALREIRATRSRFLSILVLSALAVCFLAGLRATEPGYEKQRRPLSGQSAAHGSAGGCHPGTHR